MLLILSKKTISKTPILGEVGGCNKRLFWLRACVLQTVTSYGRLGGPFLDKICSCSKNTVKMGIFAHCLEHQKKAHKYHFEGLFSGPNRGYYLGQVKMSGCRHHQVVMWNQH